MENITYINGIITYRDYNYQYKSCEKVDNMCVHVFMGEGVYAFIGNETTINNVLQPDADAIITTLQITLLQ